jgi:hypothetical protein
MHSWLFVRFLPAATVKMVNKSRIIKTYSLMKIFLFKTHFELASCFEVDLHLSERRDLNAAHDGL